MVNSTWREGHAKLQADVKMRLKRVHSKVSSVCSGVNRWFNFLRTLLTQLCGRILNGVERLDSHSAAGQCAVNIICKAVALLGSTLLVELIYHARPYYWVIVNMVFYMLYVALISIGKVILWSFNVVYGTVCWLVRLLVFSVIARIGTMLIQVLRFLPRIASLVLSVVIRVSKRVIDATLIGIFTINWNSAVPALFVGVISAIMFVLLKKKYSSEAIKPEIPVPERREDGPVHFKSDEVTSGSSARNATSGCVETAFICSDLLLGRCTKGQKCQRFHCSTPYYWQYKLSGSDQWQNFQPPDNVQIEQLFCDSALERKTVVESNLKGNYFTSSRILRCSSSYSLNFDGMIMQYRTSPQASIRRLSTPSYMQEPGNVLSTKWKWYWLDDDGWKKYGANEGSIGPKQEDIEASYVRGDKLFQFSTSSNKYEIFFCDVLMYQRNLNPTYFTMRNVRRRPLYVSETELQERKRSAGSSSAVCIKLPSHWTPVPPNTDFVRVPLSRDSKEFQDVKTLFHETIKQRESAVLAVERVQNPFLWERYARKRDQMKKKLKAATDQQIEKRLFHGTSALVLDAICKQNFDHRLRGKHGTLYGEGSYFATTASYSNNYSNQDGATKTRFMFLANILTGAYAQGNTSLRRPPSRDPSDPASDLYDSCVDKIENPTIFVIFHDEQCYPSYLVKYDRY